MGTVRKWITPALLATVISIQGCGGGGGGGGGASTPGSNVQPISVGAGLGGTVNLLSTSVTLCVPGSSTCQTIDNIVVDTGSTGLRIMSSVLSLSLPQQTQANIGPVVECAQFAGGFSWGPVKLADLRISGELASSLPIQVIDDPQFPLVPSRCSNTGAGVITDLASNLHANGILGLGVFRQDCGNACATQVVLNTIYYTCLPAAACQLVLTPVNLQVQHPVSMFAVNNNGVIIELPSVPAAGAVSVSGSLVFGIGTQANNALGAANVISVDPSLGTFTTNFNGATGIPSFIDSGSNGLFFQDTDIAVCPIASGAPGFYCPASTFNDSAAILLANGTSATVKFSIGNAATLFADNPGFAAFGNLGAPFGANGFDWGLPFFFGRNVYTAIEKAVTPGGPTGPYVAF